MQVCWISACHDIDFRFNSDELVHHALVCRGLRPAVQGVQDERGAGAAHPRRRAARLRAEGRREVDVGALCYQGVIKFQEQTLPAVNKAALRTATGRKKFLTQKHLFSGAQVQQETAIERKK
jgi:hypothetical protein